MQTMKKIIKNPLGLIGLILVLSWALIALFAPLLAPPGNVRNPYMIHRIGYSSLPQPPSEAAPLGITGGGYNIYYGLIWGARTAFRIGFIVVGASALIGVTIGGISAYLGGIVDEIIMRIVDLFMSFPFLIGVIIMTVVFGKGLNIVIIALILFGWRGYARVIRSEVLSLKERDYITAAKALGLSRSRIFLRHILPNAIFPILVLASLDIGRMVLLAASMSFIGVGSEPGYADWGQMINFARPWLMGTVGKPFAFWYTYFYPSLAISTFILGWTLLGDVLRDIFDPQLRGT